MGLVQFAVSESVQHYVLVGGKPVSLDDDYAEVCEAVESPRTRRVREERLVKEAAEADTNWRRLADNRPPKGGPRATKRQDRGPKMGFSSRRRTYFT